MRRPGLFSLSLLAMFLQAAFAAFALAQSPLKVTGLPEDAPLKISATATSSEIVVEVQIQPEWHMYGRDTGSGQPVTLKLGDGAHFAAVGSLRVPMNAAGEVAGSQRLVQAISRVAPGNAVQASLRFQVCDAMMCLEPMEISLNGEVAALKVLLVVDEKGERSQRIADWLAKRGFAQTVTTYAEVSSELCDASDVVIADSRLFRKGKRVDPESFPRTKTPVVAVGLNGTRLIEAHGLAMTSGYI